MKKLIIAGAGIAALGLAILPVAGAFASITDTVTITIGSSCTVGSSDATHGAGANLSANVGNGQLETFTAGTAGGAIHVSCNSASGWHITAVGSSTGSDITAMAKQGGGTGIATGTADSGATSNWAFMVDGTGEESPYDTWAAVPSTAQKVAGGSGAISEGVISTGYRVWVSATQAAGTYEGKVTYTVAEGIN